MKLAIDEAVSYLIDVEWDYKHNRRLERQVRAARFRYQVSLEELDFNLDRNIDKNKIMRLSDCSWIKKGEDILITGPTGIGKSYLGTVLGFQACQYGYSVGYYASSRLFTELEMGKTDGSFLKIMSKILKHNLILLNDLGLEKLSDVSRMALLEIIEEFHRRKSVIIVAQIPVSLWPNIIGEPTIADAIMDRVIFNSHRIELQGESVRRKMYGLD